MGGGHGFLGTVGPEVVAGNHRPVFLEPPYERERQPPFIRRLRVGDLGEEGWRVRDQKSLGLLNAERKGLSGHLTSGIAAKAHAGVMRLVHEVVGDLYTRRRKKRKIRELRGPFTSFRKSNPRHPRITELEIAHFAKNHREEERLLRIIQTDGWRRVLATVDPASTPRLSKIIRKMDGRENKALTFQRAAPIHHAGAIYMGVQEKCEILAL